MTSRLRSCVALLSLSAVLAGVPTASAQSGTTRTADARTASAQDMATAEAQATRLRAQLAALRAEASASVARYEQAEDALALAARESTTAGRQAEQARASSQAEKAKAGARVGALYRRGPAGMWVSLLEARSPQDLLVRYDSVSAVVRSDSRSRAVAAGASAELQTKEAAARRRAGEQARLTAEMSRQSRRLKESQAAQQAKLDNATALVRRLAERQRQVARREAARRLREQQRRAADASAAAASAAAARAAIRPGGVGPGAVPPRGVLPGGVPPGGALPGGYPPGGGTAANASDAVLPYAGPSAYCPVAATHSFVDTWHAPRSGGRLHQGTDLFAPEGSPAYAVVTGVIEQVGHGGLGGVTLWLRGDNGDRYYYAHNQANMVVAGQRVAGGQVIALVGRTGNAETTPAHVHFQAQPGGTHNANPYPWLAAICAD